MARAATTTDAWNAVAEPQRRRILTLLRGGEQPVTEVARALRMDQPRASKHLRVLREVGLVRVREQGRQRLYALDARGLRPSTSGWAASSASGTELRAARRLRAGARRGGGEEAMSTVRALSRSRSGRW